MTKTDPAIIQGYLEDSSNLTGGHADGLYLPTSESEVKEVLAECQAQKIPLTISAGQTGTTGGCIPFGGWLLSTQKFNKIISVDAKHKKAIVQPGVTLEELAKAAEREGLLYPPDPTEKSATIGGNVATNASGGRCYRFGSTRNWVKRLQIALTNGRTLELSRPGQLLSFELVPRYQMPLTKNSAGYYSAPDMNEIDLFIGSEGTLGIVTKIEVGLVPALKETLDLVAFFPSEELAVDFVFKARATAATNINFFEFFDENTLKMLRPSYPKIPSDAKAAIYLEQEEGKAEDWPELGDCWLGLTTKQKEELRLFRHAIPEHINEIFKQHHQVKLATDIAVPEDKFKEMLAFYNSQLTTNDSQLFWIKFGHIGDNHLHVNLIAKEQKYFTLAQELVMKFVKKAVSLGGTVSAEHGIGKIKREYLKEQYGEAGIKEIARVKRHFDPAGILNQGNLIEKI